MLNLSFGVSEVCERTNRDSNSSTTWNRTVEAMIENTGEGVPKALARGTLSIS